MLGGGTSKEIPDGIVCGPVHRPPNKANYEYQTKTLANVKIVIYDDISTL